MEPQTLKQLPALPYTPITFILTQTIGLPNKQKKINGNKNGLMHEDQYKDILVPVSVGPINMCHLYYLFHIPSIYNWLRSLPITPIINQKQLLYSYIDNKLKPNKNNSNKTTSKEKHFIQKQNIIKKIFEYGKNWETVKKCAQVQFKVNHSAQSNNQPICRHAIKMQLWSSSYTFNQSSQKLLVNSYFCRHCNKNISLSNSHPNYQIQKLPIAPVFDKYYGDNIKILSSQGPVSYSLSQIYTPQTVNIKSANNLWYQAQIDGEWIGKMELSNNDFITNKKKGVQGVFVYIRNQVSEALGVLKMATSQTHNQCSQYSQQIQEDSEDLEKQTKGQTIQSIFSMGKNKKSKSPKQANPPETNNVLPKLLSVPFSKQPQNNKSKHTPVPEFSNSIEVLGNEEMLQQLPTKSIQSHIVLNPNTSITSKYEKEVSQLYLKPKQKDEYEKDYDKGKTKKIKKKVEYIKPDYNQIHKMVKKDNLNIVIEADQAKKQGITLRKLQKQKQKQARNPGSTQKKQWGSGNDRGRERNDRGNWGGRGRGRGGGRQAFKKWKRDKKEDFVQRFEAS